MRVPEEYEADREAEILVRFTMDEMICEQAVKVSDIPLQEKKQAEVSGM